MKKSVIKRRKRVVPAANETDGAILHQNSFAVSPSPQPHQLDTHSHLRQRAGSAFELGGHDARSSPLMVEHPGIRAGDRRNNSYSQPTHTSQGNIHQSHHKVGGNRSYGAGTLGVDFTGYQIKNGNETPSSRQPQAPPHSSQQLPPVSSFGHETRTRTSDFDNCSRTSPLNRGRKRSHSGTEQSSPALLVGSADDPNRPRLSSISQILNTPQHVSTVEELPIDPHLSTLPPHLQQHRQSTPLTPHAQHIASAAIAQGQSRGDGTKKGPSNESPVSEQGEKMARLKREAEQMRELLRSKEREIQEMERGRELMD